MQGPQDPNLPERRPATQRAPARSFTTQELEAVIRRAIELQSGSAGEDGVPEVDIVRIGQELGLEPSAVRRAMAEVRSRPPEETGALVSLVGPATVRAARVLRRPAASTGLLLERYLRESELMVPQRRFTDRTRYLRDDSIAATLARFGRGFSRSHPPLNLKQLDVAVTALDGESCLLELSAELTGTRGGLVAGVLGGGTTVAGAWAVVVWATAIADPLMLLGIPVVAGSWAGMRAIYGTVSNSVQEKLESLLDRIEHNELK